MDITVRQFQDYLAHHYKKFNDDQGLFMKLVEEIGEVAEVLNMRSGRKAAESERLQEELGKELADVVHYAVAIAAVNDIDLTQTILQKDQKASVKYHHDMNLETFVADGCGK